MRSIVELRQGPKQFRAKLVEILGHDNDDLALLEVPAKHAGVPIPLGNDAWIDDSLVLVGYPESGEDQALDSLSATYEACTDLADQRPHAGRRFLHKFKSAHVVSGFSGGPLVSLEHMQAIGIVSHTRSQSSAIGGWAVPVEVACDILATIRQAGQSTLFQAPIEWRNAVQERARLITERQQRSRGILSGLQSLLPHATAIGNFVTNYLGTAQNPEPFGGRDQEMEILTEWVRDDAVNPYLIVTAPLGRGKSALLVHWSARLLEDASDSYHVVFVPVSIRYDLNTPTAVFSALGARLCAMHAVSNPLPLDAPADLWRELVSQLLRKDLPPGVRLVVVLDGIDESAGWELGPGTFPITPAARVKVILSARDRADRVGAQWLETLNWLDPSVARLMPLGGLDHGGVEKVLRKILQQELLAANPTLIDELWRLCGGDPLVLNLYAKALREHRPTSDNPIGIDDLPNIAPGLEGFFTRWWNDQLRLWEANKSTNLRRTTYALFNAFALAFGPLERGDLLALLRRVLPAVSGDDLDEAVGALARFITRDDLRNAYVLGHPRFGDYRLARLRADGDYDEYEKAFLAWGKEFTQPSAAGRTTLKPSRYIVHYYLAHLDRAEAKPEDVLELLSLGWRTAWQNYVDEFGSFAVVLDEVQRRLARYDRDALRQGRSASFKGQQLGCALELAELRDTSRSVAPEMLGSLVKFRLSSISIALQHIARLEHGWERAACLANVIPFVDRVQLPRVEQLVDDLKDEHHDHLAHVFGALCTRICELESVEAAHALVPVAPAGYPRATVLMNLARLSQSRIREEELVASFVEFDACNRFQKADLLRRYFEDFLAKDDGGSARFKRHILARVRKFVREQSGGELNFRLLASPVRCQFLEYLLPFMSTSERHDVVTRYFAGVLKSYPAEIFWYVAEFFIANGHVFDEFLVGEAIRVIGHILGVGGDRTRNGFDFAAPILSLWPQLTTQQRGKWQPSLFDAVSRVSEWSTINDREDCFKLMGKVGFIDAALKIIEACPLDDWHTERLITAIAPYLSEDDARRALTLVPQIRLETQERAQRAVLARLASFTAASALDAQRYAGVLDIYLEAHLASSIIRARATGGVGTTPALLDTLREIEDPDLRFSALQVCVPIFEPLEGHAVASLTRSFIEGDGRAGRLGVAAFGILAEKINVRDLSSPIVLSLVARLLAAVPSEDKIELMTPYFVQAARAGLATEIVGLVEAVGSAAFEIPSVVAIFGIAAASKDANLISWACERARELKDEWFRLAAFAALREFIGAGVLMDTWQQAAKQLNNLEIIVNARSIAGFIRKIPKVEQGEYFERVARHCTFSLSGGYTAPEAIQTLAGIAPLEWLEEWQQKIGEVDSHSQQRELRSAFCVRYSELRHYQNALALMRFADGRELTKILSRSIPHLDRAARSAALDLMLDKSIPRDHRLLAWAGFNREWDAIDLGEAFEIADRWLRHVPHQALGAGLLDLCGISECLQRVAGPEALTIALSVVERMVTKTHSAQSKFN